VQKHHEQISWTTESTSAICTWRLEAFQYLGLDRMLRREVPLR